MQGNLTTAEARRAHRGGLDEAEMDRIVLEMEKDAWEGETAAPRYVVVRNVDGFEPEFLTDDLEAARLGAILFGGSVFSVVPVTA